MVDSLVAQQVPDIPGAVAWRNGMVLEPAHFLDTDARNARLAHLSGLVADPWPWGFTSVRVDETALANRQLRVDCAGIFADGVPLERVQLSAGLAEGANGEVLHYHVARSREDGAPVLRAGAEPAGEDLLPVARLAWRGGVWAHEPGWSPPALLIGADHPMREDINRELGALAAIGVGFVATLRMPGAENRPAARVLGQVAVTVAQGVGVIEALLAAPVVSPGRVGLEALRLTLGVRTAAGIFEPMDGAWSQADQRGSLRSILGAAVSAASGVGLPFRTSVFQPSPDAPDVLIADVVSGKLVLAIEASRPEDLAVARSWFDGSALAAPDRIQEALSRRVAGCHRRPVDRDPAIGVSSGPLLALYAVEDDLAWRAGKQELALASKSPPPPNTSFSILIPEGRAQEPSRLPSSLARPGA